MKKLTFKVSMQKGTKITSIIKEINKISCRINFDMENSTITVQDVNDNEIDNVIDFVDKYYAILKVDIDNIIEVTDKKEEISDEPAIEEETVEVETKIVEEKTEEAVPKKEPEVLEPQSADDLIIKKVEFENKYVENLLNKFLRTAYWAMYKQNAFEKEVGNYIYTCMTELSLRYNKSEWKNVPASIGDIVECNYGTHLPGEINGPYVHGIVCDISDTGRVYIVPINKPELESVASKSYLNFSVPEDAEYKSDIHTGGVAILDKGKYIHSARMNSILGKTSENFFKKLLDKLLYTFDFRSYDDILEDETEEITEIFRESKETSDESVEASEEIIQEETPNKKLSEEAALLEIALVKNALDKVDSDEAVLCQAEKFIREIGLAVKMPVVKAFECACYIKTITYSSVIQKLQETMPNAKAGAIKQTLQQYFKDWLESQPDLAEKCPRISIISLIKVFAKKFK